MNIFYSYYGRIEEKNITQDLAVFALAQCEVYLKQKAADEKIAAELRARNHARKQSKNETKGTIA